MSSYGLTFRKITTSIAETVLKIFWLFPIKKDQVMFISYTGAYSDNPKYTFIELKTKCPDNRYVWAVNNKSQNEPEILNCKKVQFGSLAYYKEICRSRVVVLNNFINTYIPRRKGQDFINTWHGGSPLKTVGMVGGPISDFDRYFYGKHREKYSIFLSSSKFMTDEVFGKSFSYNGTVFNCGLPRNAPLFRESESAKRKVAKFFDVQIDDKNGIVLYAPTFRGGASNAGFIPVEKQFDIGQCVRQMEERFGKKYTMLFRSHYFKDNIPEHCKIASDYPDMQELMIAADILITDYSSCMGDMCLMYKPTFLYVPDLYEYMSESGFYWDIYSLPFPVSINEEHFYRSIKEFDQSVYEQGVDKYLERLGSYEGPDSDIKFADYICKLMEKDI